MIVVLLGQIASGKTVQAEMLTKHRGAMRLSLGAVLRHQFPDDPRISDGELLPAAMVEAAVAGFFEQNVHDKNQLVVIDGFPRTLDQKEWLDDYLATHNLSVSRAIVIEVDDQEIDRRLNGRHRADDTPEAIAKRKKVFYEQVESVIQAYKHDDVLFRVDGNAPVDTVAERVEAIL